MNAVGYDRDFALVQRNGPAVRLTVTTIPGWRRWSSTSRRGCSGSRPGSA